MEWFLKNPNSPEERHQKRMSLEPVVFGILRERYTSVLKGFWDSVQIPKEGDKLVVLMEGRLHPNLEFCLWNLAYFARGWRILVVCSPQNLGFLQELTKGKGVELQCLFQQDVSKRELGFHEYNSMMKSKDFYLSLPNCEHLLFAQTDTYLRKPIPESLFTYDGVASSFLWNTEEAGGGLTYRRRSVMLEILETIPPESIWAEDSYFWNGCRQLGKRLPGFEEGLEFFVESCLYEDPVGVHQWWTFFLLTPEEQDILESLVTLHT